MWHSYIISYKGHLKGYVVKLIELHTVKHMNNLLHLHSGLPHDADALETTTACIIITH